MNRDDNDSREILSQPAQAGPQGSGCCSEARQASCCELSHKAECCGPSNEATRSGGCGCQ